MLGRGPRCLLVFAVTTVLAFAVDSAPAEAAACGEDAHLELKAPPRVVVGRNGLVTVTHGATSHSILRGATFQMADQATGAVFFSAEISDKLILEEDKANLFIRLDPGDGPAIVRLAWEFDEPYQPGATCQGYSQAVVTPTAGQLPAPRFREDDGGTAGMSLAAKGGCDVTTPGPARVVFQTKRRSAVFSSPDPCAAAWKRVSGRIPGLAIGTDDLNINLRAPGGPHITEAKVKVYAGKKLVSTRWVTAYVSRQRAKRIYQGTDAFQNYCINRDRTLYSRHHRLYCVKPGFTTRFVIFTRKR